jgi:hypothetical protein
MVKHLRVSEFIFSLSLFLVLRQHDFAQAPAIPYFGLGSHLVEEFRGTYAFKFKRIEFTKTRNGYMAHSSGDESPSDDQLLVQDNSVDWILGSSGEKWLSIKTRLEVGDEWGHIVRHWKQKYRVTHTDQTIIVPAGTFRGCATVEITWIAHEHDMEGPQRVVLFLAPGLGIIKREEWSNGEKWHEEVLTKYVRDSSNAGN